MSGIAGLMYLDEQAVARDDLDRMRTTLALHGPDRSGIWQQGSVGLVHCLMRYTPEDAFEHQPLRDGGGVCLCFDGRLDNREELARALEIPADRLATLPDSALVMAAYGRWGEDFPKRLVGAFAAIVWDPAQRRLLCARDPMGERPLCYTRQGDRLAVASMPSGLFALPWVPRRLDRQAMAERLVLLLADPEQTPFDAVRQLPGGHLLLADPTGLRTRPYWSFDPGKTLRFQRDEDYVEAFLEHYREAVRCRLRSATPVATTLSGGLDSSSVTWLAADLLARRGERIASYTAMPRSGFTCEAPSGRIVDPSGRVEDIRAMLANLDVHYVRTEGATMLDDMERWFAAADMPMLNPCNQIWFSAIMRTAGDHGRRVLLTGERGNRSVSWEGSGYLPGLLRQGRLVALLSETAKLAQARRRPFVNTLYGALAPMLPSTLWRIKTMRSHGMTDTAPFWRAYSALAPAAEAELDLSARFKALGWDIWRQKPSDTVAHRIRFFTRHPAATYSGPHWAGWSGGYGIDVRDPTHDRRLVEFCLALPEEQYHKHGVERRLIRRAMAGRLPDSVVWDSRRELQAPDWYEQLAAIRHRLPEELDAIAQCETAAGLLDVARMRRLLSDWPDGGWNTDARVYPYRLLLQRGVATGRFMRWFEGGNR